MRRGAELAVLLTAVAAQQPRAPPTATHGQREPPAQHAADEPERCPAASFRWSPGEHRINITTAQDEPFHQRSFLLLVPRTMPADGQRVPALVAWHGSSESPWYQSVLIDAQPNADRYGWIVAIPFGTAAHHTDTCCPDDGSCPLDSMCRPGLCLDKPNRCQWANGPMAGPARRGADDVALARLIVDWLVDHACVSRQHVFSSGFSNGARMSLRLGCEAADLFAGIAPGAGTSSFEPPCLPSRPISYLGFSGTEDHVSPASVCPATHADV